jgi:hemoglobin/transferrin/lactoferrin receptor protein
LQYSNSTDIPRFDKLNEYKEGSLRYAEWYYGPQKRFLASAQLSILPDLKWIKDGKITLAYQDIYESRNSRSFGSLEKSFRNENVKVASLNGDFHIPLTQDNKRILSYGFETSYNKVNSKAIGRVLTIANNHVTGFANDFTIQSRYPDGGSSYTNFALYTNYRLDHSKKGTLNLGLRYTYTFLKAKWIDETFIRLPDMDISLYNSAFSGTLGYAYKPTIKWQLNAVLSSGFRSPNIDDVGKIREKKGNLTIPNTNLKPEHAYNAEIGVVHFSDTKKTMFGFNTFYMLLTNYITRDFYTLNGNEELLYDGSLSRLQANINKGTAYVIGTTLSFQSKLSEHLKLNASSTYTQGQTYDTGEPMSSIPPLFGNASVTYHLKKWNFDLSFRFNARKRPEDYNITEGIDNLDESILINEDSDEYITKYYGTPSWQIFNFSTQYKLSKIATLHLNVDNILDQHYKEFASGISAPGRNVSIVLNAHF